MYYQKPFLQPVFEPEPPVWEDGHSIPLAPTALWFMEKELQSLKKVTNKKI